MNAYCLDIGSFLDVRELDTLLLKVLTPGDSKMREALAQPTSPHNLKKQ